MKKFIGKILLSASAYFALIFCATAASLFTEATATCGTVFGTSFATKSCSGVPAGFPAELEMSATGRAAFGSLGVLAETFLTTEDNIPGDNIGGQIRGQSLARASFSDELTVSNAPTSGFLSFQFDLSGGIAFDVVPGNTTGGLQGAGAVIVVGINQSEIFRSSVDLGGTTQSGKLSFDLAYSGARVNLSAFLTGINVCGTVNRGSEFCDISVNFLSTLTLLGTTVLDSNLNVVPDAMIASSSGFDYLQGVTPVPLPAALPLFAGGLGLFGLLGWRRRRVTEA